MKEQLYLGNMVFDITQTLRDYDYTKRSVVNFNRIISSQQFDDMPSDVIFRYLNEQMEVVSFGDYLRRYLYEKTAPPGEYARVSEDYYVSVIRDSFTINRAPYSFTPVKSRKINIIKRWLHSDSVKRSSVFLLGFGLNMTDKEVSEFLTKVIKEQDFRLDDPCEAVYWHCFHHGLPYSKAVSLLEKYENAEDPNDREDSSRYWESVRGSLPVYLSNEKKLEEYLGYLKQSRPDDDDLIFEEFRKVYDRAAAAARTAIREEDDEAAVKENPSFSGAYDIESVLCSGTPRTKNKNVISMSYSVLAGQFSGKHMTRQRIGRLLRRETQAERFDLITLLFLDYAVSVEPEWPTSRYMQFIDEINGILGRCRMMGIYPVNPYESFVLMCLLTDDPLTVYNDVWEVSFTRE